MVIIGQLETLLSYVSSYATRIKTNNIYILISKLEYNIKLCTAKQKGSGQYKYLNHQIWYTCSIIVYTGSNNLTSLKPVANI